MQLTNISEYEKQLCNIFAIHCVKTNLDEYQRRNQYETKIIKDIAQGKAAEIMVHKALKTSYPDFFIYDQSKKSYEADLYLNEKKIHVKSCKLNGYCPSWVFQPNDPLTIDPDKNDYLALVVLCNEPYMYFTPAIGVEYHPPRKKSLNKKVIYQWSLKM